jgi:hypothetical protein
MSIFSRSLFAPVPSELCAEQRTKTGVTYRGLRSQDCPGICGDGLLDYEMHLLIVFALRGHRPA